MVARPTRYTRFSLCLLLVSLFGETASAQVPPWKRRGRKRTVYIDSSPQQAAVYIEQESYGIACYTPCKIRLPYKRNFTVFLVRPGFQKYKGSIYVGRRRRDRKYFFVLKREIQPGVIDVRADPSNTALGARIKVDGAVLGTVPSRIKVKPGRHELEIDKPGFKPWRQWVDVAERQVFTVVVTLEPKEKPTGSILVTSNPAGADVYVDGKRVDTTPCVVQKLAPGAHTVEIRQKGRPVWKQIVEVRANAQVKVTADLGPKTPPGGLTGALRILSNVPKAEVYVDGDFKGHAPVTVDRLVPGDHLVEVKAKGYKPREARVKVIAQQQTLVKLDLEPKPEEKPVGRISVLSDVPGASVFVDGAPVGKVPLKKYEVEPGKHIVIVRKPGYRDYKVTIQVSKGQLATVTAQLKAVGVIKVVTPKPGAEVYIDSVKVGTTPLEGHELEAGEYTLEVRMPGGEYEPYRTTFAIKGGERKTFPVELVPVRRGPTPEQVAAMKKGLSSFSARTVPPRSFTADVSVGFPYILAGQLTVGAWRHGMFGVDAGLSFRSLFLFMNEFALHARGQLFARGPFSLGLFTELGAGVGLDQRNSFFFNIGPIFTLSFRNVVTASIALWFNVYSDRICHESPADPERGETEPGICKYTEGWPSDPNAAGGWDPDRQNSGRRDPPYEMVNGEKVYLQPKIFQDHKLRERFTGWKFYITFTVETAITKFLSVYVKLDFVPAQNEQQRALYMEFYTASDEKYHPATANKKPYIETSGVLPEVDWGFYGQAGVTFKF